MVTFADLHRALSGAPTGLTFVLALIAGLGFYRVVAAVLNAAARRQDRPVETADTATFQQSPYVHVSRNH